MTCFVAALQAQDSVSKEIMAVKVYNLKALGELNKVQLIREIRLHGGFTHRNIIELYVSFQVNYTHLGLGAFWAPGLCTQADRLWCGQYDCHDSCHTQCDRLCHLGSRSRFLSCAVHSHQVHEYAVGATDVVTTCTACMIVQYTTAAL